MYGWTGTILRVDLTDGNVTKQPLEDEIAYPYVGGKGFNIKFLYDELKSNVDPLGPENKVIFGAGPACGTLVPGSQRWTVSAKSPLSGFIGDANCGSTFGVALKYAGYDMLIIEWESERPTYLVIDDDRVYLRDASHLWGKTTNEVARTLKRELGDPDFSIACIGPAGENLLRFASVQSEGRSAARCGIGAVLGSKRLKAIAVRGRNGIKVAHPDRVEKVSWQIYRNWQEKNSARLKLLNEFGGGVNLMKVFNDLGMIGAKNYREGTLEGYDSVSPERIKEYWVKPRSCFSCPIACNHLFVVPEGPFAGTFGEGLYAPAQQYTARIGNTDLKSMFKLAALSDEYGLDEMNMASVFGFAMECFEAGILTPSDLDGLQLGWGNTTAMLQLMEMVVHRNGIGNIFAEGATKASKIIGKGSERYVMEVKGMSIDAKDPRGSKSYALGYAVASRGAEHCRHITPDWLSNNHHYPEETWMKQEIKNFKGFDRLSEEGKSEMYKYFEDVRGGFQQCLELCLFVLFSPDIPWPEILAEVFNGVTGHDMSPQEVKIVGERITNLERAFNLREGLTRKDDRLPERFLKEPLSIGASKGQVVDLERMIDEYYVCRGWEKRTGFPTRAKLEEIGLKEIADELEKMGRLGRPDNL
jgi:aldehyde:ferredoxin oxidoreductase